MSYKLPQNEAQKNNAKANEAQKANAKELEKSQTGQQTDSEKNNKKLEQQYKESSEQSTPKAKSPRSTAKKPTQSSTGKPRTAPNSLKEEKVVVNENENLEAVNGTTKDGNKKEITNLDNIPQNGVTHVDTTPPPNDIAKEADAARDKTEVKFADEANPNRKGRTKGAANAQEDVDRNERSGGKSYGVSLDNPQNKPLEQDGKVGASNG